MVTFADNTEGEHNATHNGRGTDQTSDGIQPSSDNTEGGGRITHTRVTSETSTETKHSGAYYKMFLFYMFQLFTKYG